MFIAFEGPAFSGKTTQAKKLVDYINETYQGKAVYIPFKSISKDKMDIYKGCMDNASSYIMTNLLDFYTTMNCKEKARDKKAIYILDGYYYDTMLTAKVMFEESKRKKKCDYKQFNLLEINDFVRMLAHRLSLPVPNMLFLLMPDIDVMRARVPENKKDEDNLYLYSKIYQEYLLSLQDCTMYHERIPELINPIVIRDYSTATGMCYFGEILSKVQSNSRSMDEIHLIIRNIFDKYADLVTNSVIGPDTDKDLIANLERIRSQLSPYREMLEKNSEQVVETKNDEVPDEEIIKKYGFNQTQLKIFKDMAMDPTKVIYHYEEFYNNDNYTPRQKFTIIETMIRMLTACIDNNYIYNISEAYNTISKLRAHIESLTDVGEANVNETDSSVKKDDVKQNRGTERQK